MDPIDEESSAVRYECHDHSYANLSICPPNISITSEHSYHLPDNSHLTTKRFKSDHSYDLVSSSTDDSLLQEQYATRDSGSCNDFKMEHDEIDQTKDMQCQPYDSQQIADAKDEAFVLYVRMCLKSLPPTKRNQVCHEISQILHRATNETKGDNATINSFT